MLKAILRRIDNTANEFEVFIECDEAGLDRLRQDLDHIIQGSTDHAHYMSESWGVGDIEGGSSASELVVQHVKVLRVDGKLL